jgi:hypothetical protein
MGHFRKLAACAAIAAGSFTLSATAETCLSGDALYAAFEKDYSSSNDTRARAILYWQDTGASAVDHLGKIYTSLSECRKGLCDTGDDDYPEMAAYKQYYSDTFKRENGYSEKEPVYAGFDAPPPAMLQWAEARLGCTAGPTLAERTAEAATPTPAPAPAPAPQIMAAAPPAPQPVAQQSMAPPAPVSACSLSPEELEDPHSFVRIDEKYAVIAWWALHGRDAIPKMVERVGETQAREVWTNWTVKGKIKSGQPNSYGVKSDAKVYKALKKYKKVPWERVDMYPSREAVSMITKAFGDCFGERSADLDFEELGLVRGNFAADFCNAAAVMPGIDDWNAPDEHKPFRYWAENQLKHHNTEGCGFVPEIAYNWAQENEVTGAEAAKEVRRAAQEEFWRRKADAAAKKGWEKDYQAAKARQQVYIDQERAKRAAQEQARKDAADAAYNQMITDSQNQVPQAPSSNRRDCYDQGDGTEKCFYD